MYHNYDKRPKIIDDMSEIYEYVKKMEKENYELKKEKAKLEVRLEIALGMKEDK